MTFQPHQRRAALLQTRALLQQADQTWAKWSCPGTAECCQLAVTRRQPWLWPSEWQVLLDALQRQGRALPAERADGGCPLLDGPGRRCTVYEDRPLGCRTFFCHRIAGPARQPIEAMDRLMSKLERLNLELDDTAAPRPLLDWFNDATP